MAVIIPTGFGQVILPFKHAGLAREALLVYGVDLSAAGGNFVAAADQQVDAFNLWWVNELDSEVTVGPATIRVGQDGGDPLSVEGSTTFVGDETGAMASPNVALLVKKSSALGGRRGRGRFYIPWVLLDAAVTDVGAVEAGSLAVRQTDATGWFQELLNGTVGPFETPLVILHDSSGPGVEPPPSEVTALTVDPVVATQRRRLGR